MEKKWVKPKIEHKKLTKWQWAVWCPDKLKLGRNVDIGAFTLILAHNGVEIGDDVQIGNHCSIISHSSIDNKNGKVVIGKGARIGMHSSIMPGVHIGENALVAAHSFVTKDVKEGETVYGIPARKRTI